jgi:mycothiol synthase
VTVESRPSGPDDAAAIAEVCNALSNAMHGTTDVSEEHVRHWFDLPHLAFWVAEDEGRVIGHLDVQHEREPNRFEADVRVHPDAWGEGVADMLLETAEAWAREHGEAGATVRAFPGEPEAELREALERRGYRLVRHFFRMHIDLEGEPRSVEWPPGVSARAFAEADTERVHAAHMESFADHWGFLHVPLDEWRVYMIEEPHGDPVLWQLAEADGELAGFTINGWHASGDRSFGWVRVLGVRPRWRHRGIGEALLRSSFEEFRRRGAERVGLGVDAGNTTGAVRLYERAGMSVARREDTYERTL